MQYWMAEFDGATDGDNALVSKVRIQNNMYEPDALGNAEVRILDYAGTAVCGNLPHTTEAGKWYELKCKQPLHGISVKISSTNGKMIAIS